ncbi:cyclic-guanylate-specific phosphodiesterase [Dickeya dadantii]|uniref:cyclic-guanylate-specific phosphodiesterase n=1 Tax=Dickeya dadantii TaxID=204038 RepID=UPI001C0B9677|nr:cyclic-guanylate-specific phosphodiesterase [Dickeya dadantii]MCA7014540.1 cyclic-guanylate-specific phosphodiesterase [Dickeya dadantii]QWT41668.1 cyclic-guanylate-specific phosphodiesterase [Dickeya dadantii]
MAEHIVQQNSHFNQPGSEASITGEVQFADADYWHSCHRRYRFQPIYRTSGHLMGIELLTAVFHPSMPHKFLSPEHYFARLNVEERLNIVIEQLQLLSQWHDRFVQDGLRASVNIDGLTLLALQENLKAKKLLATMPWLRFELVESLAVLPHDTLATLPEAGQLWLDDFGCGVANFSSLAPARYDCIKIARELFIMLLKSEEGRRLFTSLVTLIATYCNDVVIEGVETEEEWEIVRQSNASAAQGYFLSRPQPFENLEDLRSEL